MRRRERDGDGKRSERSDCTEENDEERETENLQGQMYVVCCSYQDQILSRKKYAVLLISSVSPRWNLCVRETAEWVVFVCVRRLEGFCV